MNTYKVHIVTKDDSVDIELEALQASINYNNGVIEAVKAEGHFHVIKLPEDWLEIEAEEIKPEVAVAPPFAPPIPVPVQ